MHDAVFSDVHRADLDAIAQRNRRQGQGLTATIEHGRQVEEHTATAGIALEHDHRVRRTVVVEVTERVQRRGPHHDLGH
jgi:hypothetical protein